MNFKLIPAWQKIAAALVVLILLGSLAYCQGRADGSNKIKADMAAAALKQSERNRGAQNKSADQRLVDALANAKSQEERNELIAASPGGAVSPADRAVACDRLQKSGYSGADLPSACRPGSGDGTQTPAQPGNRN